MKYLVWITCKLNFSPKTRKYLEKFSPEQIWRMNRETLEENGLPASLEDKSLERAERILKICEAKNIKLIAYNSAEYPECLKRHDGMPALLYVKGDINTLNDGLRVGIVGTRKSSIQGNSRTDYLAENLAREGAVIISGGASGIDSAALKAAVHLNCRTVAVLGCDIDKYYPAENFSLFTIIASNGLVMSEYPPETNARFFPARNRIIASLSERLIVGEAPEKSGALITAQYASDYGVPVFACVSEGESFGGCRELVSRGAYEVEGYRQVIKTSKAVKLSPKKRVSKQTKAEVIKKTSVDKFGIPIYDHIIECIRSGRDTTSGMLDGKFPVREILQTLTILEIKGAIVSLPGDRYRIIETYKE